MPSSLHKPKLFRDPVHDTLAWHPERAEQALLLRLLDTREVQRLRGIRQLGLSSLVYHGAEHSRFSHSMGVAWLASRMLTELGRAVPIDEGDRIATLAAALLHDVGHGPFSHAFEVATGGHHEERSSSLVASEGSEIHAALSAVDPALPAEVAARLRGQGHARPFLSAIVSSQLDADRLDYILRDGHATGVRIGAYDLERILAMLDVVDDRLVVHRGAREAVEGYLLARFHMYKQVYLHKTVRAAERMLAAALQRAGEQVRAGALAPPPGGGALGALLAGEDVSDDAFVELDDRDVWRALKAWAAGEDPVLTALAGGLVRRQLFKVVRLPEGPDVDVDGLVASARDLARSRGLDARWHVLVDQSTDSPYRPYAGPRSSGSSTSIQLTDKQGRVTPIEASSQIVQMLGRMSHTQRLLVVDPSLKSDVTKLVEGLPLWRASEG